MLLFAALLVLAQSNGPERWGGKEVVLEVGQEKRLLLPGLQLVAPSCRDSHDIKLPGAGVLWLRAVRECRGTHFIKFADGTTALMPVRSVPALPKADLRVPVKKRERALGTEVEIPEALHDLHEETAPDGGLRIVGTNDANQRVTIDIIEVRPPDAGRVK